MEKNLDLLKTIMSNLTQGICLIKISDGTVAYVNEPFEKMFGYAKDELLGKSVEIINASDDKSTKEIAEDIKVSLRKHQEWHGEVKNIKKNGTTVWSSADITAFKDPIYGDVWISVQTDITEKKNLELRMAEKEREYELIVKSVLEIVYIVRLDKSLLRGEVEFVSEKIKEILGYEGDEFKKDPSLWFRIVHPEDQKQVNESTKDMVKSKKSGVRIYRVKHKKRDDYIWMEDKITPIYNSENGGIKLQGVARDVTEEKRLEEELKNEVNSYQSLFEQAPYGIVIYDFHAKEKGVAIQFNTKAYDYLGYSKEEFAKMPITSYDTTLTPAIIKKIDDEIIKKGEAEFETQHKAKSGEIKDVLIRLRKTTINGKDFVQAAIRDITETKKVEKELRQNEEKFQLLIENATDLTTVLDNEGKIKYESPSVKSMLGYEQEELLGRKAFDFVHPDDIALVVERFDGALKTPGIPGERVKFRFKHKNGEWVHLESIGNYVPDAATINGLIVNSRDITKEMLAEEEKLREVGELEKFRKLTIGRELKMIELKKQMEELKKQLGGEGNV